MEEASANLREGLALFEEIGDKAGQLAVQGFLGLIHPTDRRVPGWLTEGVRYAEEVGDRSRQMGALVPLAWHLFFRSRLGDTDATAEAEVRARQIVDLADELGAHEFCTHGLALGASLARLAGRLDDAAAMAEEARRVLEAGLVKERALVEAALFTVALTTDGGGGQQPPRAPRTDDPALAMGRMIVAESLALAGRPEEGLEFLKSGGALPAVESLEALPVGFGVGLALVLAGHPAEARRWLETALTAAEAGAAEASAVACAALLAEVDLTDGDGDAARRRLDALSDPLPGGVADALVLRARALLGDPEARAGLAAAIERLRVPGLAL
jgi:hypothetical protein